MKLNSTGKNPCGPLAGIRDRDRRPCEGSSQASATQPVVSARTASRRLDSAEAPAGAQSRDADVRSRRSSRAYTFCAIPQLGPALTAHGCAMIFGSSRHCVNLVYTSQVAWRSTPMGIDRSNLSCRTILFFFALLVAPKVAMSATLEDSARELARKVAATLPPQGVVAVEIQNASTLTPKEVDRLSQTFSGALQDSGFNLGHDAAIHVSVVLSENVKGFLWSAEISRGEASKVLLIVVPSDLQDRPMASPMPILLRGEKFWEGPQRILDAVEMAGAKDGAMLLLLQPDGLVVRRKDDSSSFKVEIPEAQTATRVPSGSIQGENACRLLESSPCVLVTLNSLICTIALQTHKVVECHSEDTASARHFQQLRPTAQTFLRGRGEFSEMSGHCGTQVRFAAGTGDYTQPDSVQAFEEQRSTFVTLSDELSFPGPVMALHVTDRVPTAIVRNLQTGNYEAYRISVTCGG